MGLSEKSTIEDKEDVSGSGSEPQRPLAGEATEAEVLPVKEVNGEIPAVMPKKRMTMFRWLALLLVLSLAGVAVLQREWLLKQIPSRSAGQPSPMSRPARGDEPTRSGAGNLPEGTFQIAPEKQQLIGVKYGEVEYKPVSRMLRAVGRVSYDETKITRIHPKIEGWIEQVFIDFTGKEVQRGQPLISIYSPELWQTQQEYLLARTGRNELAKSPFSEAVAGSESLLQAARKRLELWDISEEQIEHLEQTGKPFKTLSLYSTSDGFVLTRNAYPKQRVTPETELYTIADLSTVWVIAEIYEYEAPEIKLGQWATITLTYLPGRTFRGKISYIYPQLDNATRTLKTRIEVRNPDLTLKPDMYANVALQINYGSRVVAPEEAVMDSGAEALVFVAHEGGYFEPRKVILGAKVGNEVIVLNGLKPGERLATSANLLIDSESKLKSAASGMGMPGMSHGDGGHTNIKPMPQTKHSQHQPAIESLPQGSPGEHSQHRSQDGTGKQ